MVWIAGGSLEVGLENGTEIGSGSNLAPDLPFCTDEEDVELQKIEENDQNGRFTEPILAQLTTLEVMNDWTLTTNSSKIRSVWIHWNLFILFFTLTLHTYFPKSKSVKIDLFLMWHNTKVSTILLFVDNVRRLEIQRK